MEGTLISYVMCFYVYVFLLNYRIFVLSNFNHIKKIPLYENKIVCGHKIMPWIQKQYSY